MPSTTTTTTTTTAIPSTGLPVGVEAGPLGRRLAAQLIDLVPPLVLGVGATIVAGRSASPRTATAILIVAWVLIVAWYVLVWTMFARRAAGPGMRAMKLQLVGLRNGRPIGWGRFLVRSLVLAALTASVVGLLLMLVFLVRHPRRQGWPDLIAESVVIKRRPLAAVSPTRSSAPAPAQTSAPPRPTTVTPARAVESATTGAAAQSSGALTRPGASSSSDAADHATTPDQATTPPESPAPAAAGAPSAPTDTAPAVPKAPPTAEADADSVQVRPRRSVPDREPADAAVTPPQPRSAVPSAAAAAAEAPVQARPSDGRPLDEGWVAVLDDQREVPVTGLVLLGRNPQARPGEEDAELVKVSDETRTVSKTHLSLRVDANGMFAMDRGSTNGTTLTNVVGVSKPCPAGAVVPVNEGAIVSFGDHWLKVERHFDR